MTNPALSNSKVHTCWLESNQVLNFTMGIKTVVKTLIYFNKIVNRVGLGAFLKGTQSCTLVWKPNLELKSWTDFIAGKPAFCKKLYIFIFFQYKKNIDIFCITKIACIISIKAIKIIQTLHFFLFIKQNHA